MDRIPDSLTEVLEDEGLADHIAKHAVTVDEVRQVIRNGFALHRNANEKTAAWVIKGTTDAGRTLLVFASWADPPNEDCLQVHTARQPTPKGRGRRTR